jgi:hypothetical protein
MGGDVHGAISLCRLEGLEALGSLRTLTLVSNCIASVENIGMLSNLQALHLQDNKLDSMTAVNLPMLCQLPQLSTLCLQNIDQSAANPVCYSSSYRDSLLQHLPGLKNLDGERCAARLADAAALPMLP